MSTTVVGTYVKLLPEHIHPHQTYKKNADSPHSNERSGKMKSINDGCHSFVILTSVFARVSIRINVECE